MIEVGVSSSPAEMYRKKTKKYAKNKGVTFMIISIADAPSVIDDEGLRKMDQLFRSSVTGFTMAWEETGMGPIYCSFSSDHAGEVSLAFKEVEDEIKKYCDEVIKAQTAIALGEWDDIFDYVEEKPRNSNGTRISTQ